MLKLISVLFSVLFTSFTSMHVAAQPMSFNDAVYTNNSGLELALDIYLPDSVEDPPLVVFVHGGRWQDGDKTTNAPLVFVEHGFALASIDFRQSHQSSFPAQIYDIKAAIRYLRANANLYGYNANKIAIAGHSSGAHLATLAGVTNGHAELEGGLEGNLDTSSNVQAILSYFGAHDLRTILSQSTPYGLSVRVPALDLLLGGQPEEKPELTQLASPVFHVDAADPPLLLLHGDEDNQMPIEQSYQMETAYKNLDLDVHFEVVTGAGHGGQKFYAPEYLETALNFLQRTIANN